MIQNFHQHNLTNCNWKGGWRMNWRGISPIVTLTALADLHIGMQLIEDNYETHHANALCKRNSFNDDIYYMLILYNYIPKLFNYTSMIIIQHDIMLILQNYIAADTLSVHADTSSLFADTLL